MKTSAPSEIISVFFDLMDDCLGSGDIDYSAKLLQSDELLLAGESPVSTPDSAKRNKRRTPSATPKSSGKRKKVNTE